MATFHNANTQWAAFQPISSALNDLPSAAGTIAVLATIDTHQDFAGMVVNALNTPGAGVVNGWYHALGTATGLGWDDDGIVGCTEQGAAWQNTNWHILAVRWANPLTAIERFHHIDIDSPAGWTHQDSTGNNGGLRAGPGTSVAHFRIGYFEDAGAAASIALVAVWAGVGLTDAQVEELSVNSRTSDWWNCSAGRPTMLVECNTLSLVDIGNNPSTFWGLSGTPPTLTGPNPPWTFDGRGSEAPPFIIPFRQF